MITPNWDWRYPLTPLKNVKYIILHHAAASRYTAEQVHNQHRNQTFTTSKGETQFWNGGGYNEYIHKDGTVYIMRGDHVGGHTEGYNSISYGIGCEGNYDIETMSETQLRALRERVKCNMTRFNAELKRHGDFNRTSCPGRNFPTNETILEGDNMWNQKAVEFVTEFQKRTGLVADGKAGNMTFGKLNELFPVKQKKYTYRMESGVHIIEIDPKDLTAALVNNTPANLPYKDFTSCMFTSSGRPLCLFVVDGKRLASPQWWDRKAKGTFHIDTSNRVSVLTLRDLANTSSTKLCIQGFNMDFEANGSSNLKESILKEGWLSDTTRPCMRPAIGYNYRTGKVIIAFQNTDASGLRATMRNLGCTDDKGNTQAIGLDAGGTTALYLDGKAVIPSQRTQRTQRTILILGE